MGLKRTIPITNVRGLHARASRKLAEIALSFEDTLIMVRREDEEAPQKIPASLRADRPVPPVIRVAPPRPTAAPPPPRGPEPISEYARRPAHQGLDSLVRQAPVHNSVEEDQLDIPAFLRRQAN